MAFTMITVTHRFTNLDGSAASGCVIFRLSQRITNGGVSYEPQVVVHANLDATGRLSQALPANDDAGTTPVGSTYTVIPQINGNTATAEVDSITIPHTAPGGTVTLGTLLPAQLGKTL